MRLVIPSTAGESREFADWVARKHDQKRWTYPGPFFGYGTKDGDEINGAIVLEPFHAPGSYLMNVSVETPDFMANRQIIKNALHVPFTELFNARRVSVIIHARYTRTIRVAEIMGFSVEATLADHFEDDDGVLMGMTKDPLGLAG